MKLKIIIVVGVMLSALVIFSMPKIETLVKGERGTERRYKNDLNNDGQWFVFWVPSSESGSYSYRIAQDDTSNMTFILDDNGKFSHFSRIGTCNSHTTSSFNTSVLDTVSINSKSNFFYINTQPVKILRASCVPQFHDYLKDKIKSCPEDEVTIRSRGMFLGGSSGNKSFRTEYFVSDKAKEYIDDLITDNNFNIKGDRYGSFKVNEDVNEKTDSLKEAFVEVSNCVNALREYKNAIEQKEKAAIDEKKRLNSLAL